MRTSQGKLIRGICPSVQSLRTLPCSGQQHLFLLPRFQERQRHTCVFPIERTPPCQKTKFLIFQLQKKMAVSEADAIKDLTDEEVEDLKETFRTFDKV